MEKEDLSIYTDEELLEKAKAQAASVRRIWSGSTDGSYECAWSFEVEPYLEELERRGIHYTI